MNQLLITYYLKEKYGNEGLKYCGICYTGSDMSNILFPIIASFIINPNNEGMNGISMNGSEKENYFEFKVAYKFEYFCWFLTIY